jgi:hypothetical protein
VLCYLGISANGVSKNLEGDNVSQLWTVVRLSPDCLVMKKIKDKQLENDGEGQALILIDTHVIFILKLPFLFFFLLFYFVFEFFFFNRL